MGWGKTGCSVGIWSFDFSYIGYGFALIASVFFTGAKALSESIFRRVQRQPAGGSDPAFGYRMNLFRIWFCFVFHHEDS